MVSLISISRQFCLPILCAVFISIGWCCSYSYAQLADVRNRPNRYERENSAQIMIQEMRTSLKNIPWSELSPASQAKIKKIVNGTPLFHRMPQQTVYADPEIYNFLLEHPDMVIGFWEYLGATQLSLRETKENHYTLKETAGTVAAVEVLYRTNDLCIVYAKGEYLGPLLTKPYSGDVLLILRTRLMRDEMNEPMVTCDLDSFVQINSLGADVLAKLFFASLTKTADSNFTVTVSFIGQVSRAAARNATGLKNSVESLSTIRQEIREEFCDVVDRTELRFARRNMPTPLASTPPYASVSTDSFSEEVPDKRELLLSLSRPPAEWGMDHLHDTPPFFEEEKTETLPTPKTIETDDSSGIIPRLPKPKK